MGKAVMEYHGCSPVNGVTCGHSGYLEDAMPLQILTQRPVLMLGAIFKHPKRYKSNPKITTWQRPESFLIIKDLSSFQFLFLSFKHFSDPYHLRHF